MSPVFFLTLRPPPSSTLFPYTTLFRSPGVREGLQRRRGEGHRRRAGQDLRCRHADRDRLLEGAERGEGPADPEGQAHAVRQTRLRKAARGDGRADRKSVV